MDIKILVAVHKPCTVPEGSVYVPVQAGRALHPAIGHIAGDDTGPNISAKTRITASLQRCIGAGKTLTPNTLALPITGVIWQSRGWGAVGPACPAKRSCSALCRAAIYFFPKSAITG